MRYRVYAISQARARNQDGTGDCSIERFYDDQPTAEREAQKLLDRNPMLVVEIEKVSS